jgi:cysteine dioxygenase
MIPKNTVDLSAFRNLETNLEPSSSMLTFQTLVQQAELQKLDLTIGTVFSVKEYHRTLLYEGKLLSVYRLSWLPEQRSDIHEHQGSLCATHVAQGKLTNRIFTLNKDELYLNSEETLLARKTTFLDREGIHQSLNVSSKPVISLHLYTPRLLGIQRFLS